MRIWPMQRVAVGGQRTNHALPFAEMSGSNSSMPTGWNFGWSGQDPNLDVWFGVYVAFYNCAYQPDSPPAQLLRLFMGSTWRWLSTYSTLKFATLGTSVNCWNVVIRPQMVSCWTASQSQVRVSAKRIESLWCRWIDNGRACEQNRWFCYDQNSCSRWDSNPYLPLPRQLWYALHHRRCSTTHIDKISFNSIWPLYQRLQD